MAWQFRKMDRKTPTAGSGATTTTGRRRRTPKPSWQNIAKMPSTAERILFSGKGRGAVLQAKKRLHGKW